MVDLLLEIDAPALDKQDIAVPKISLDRVPQRSVCRRSRRAEQLVEVPAIVPCSSLQQRTAKQTIDIPVPHGRGDRGRGRGEGGGGLQGSRPVQNSTALVEQITLTLQFLRVVVDGTFERPSRFSQSQGSTACSGADHVDTPVPESRGGEKVFLVLAQTPNSAASSSRSYAVDEPFQGVFRTFHQRNKVRGWVRTRGRNWVRTLLHGLAAAYAEFMVLDYDESEAESESEAVVEEGAATRFPAGFRPLRVCTRFLEHRMGRPVWGGVPMAIGAPSHTHWPSFTGKLQPMNNNSPRTFLTEAVEAASGPGEEGRGAGAAGWERKAAWCSCAEDRGRPVLFNDKFLQS